MSNFRASGVRSQLTKLISRHGGDLVALGLAFGSVFLLTKTAELMPIPAQDAPILGPLFTGVKVLLVGYLSFVAFKLAKAGFQAVKNSGITSTKITGISLRRNEKLEPPAVAEFLVGVCTMKRYREGLLQSLEETFYADLENDINIRRAKRRYWAAALGSIAPQLWAAAKRAGVIALLIR